MSMESIYSVATEHGLRTWCIRIADHAMWSIQRLACNLNGKFVLACPTERWCKLQSTLYWDQLSHTVHLATLVGGDEIYLGSPLFCAGLGTVQQAKKTTGWKIRYLSAHVSANSP
jgi:hypothetical protein